MSSHEIENFVEDSVRATDMAGTRIDPRTARDLIANLYRYQRRFDCGHTQGRVRDILVKFRFIVEGTLRDHPDAAMFAALFDCVERADRWCSLHEAVRNDGARGLYAYLELKPQFVAWGPTDALSVDFSDESFEFEDDAGVYYEPPRLQVEAGSTVWRRWVENGRLSGIDAEPPRAMAPHQVGARIVREAERLGEPVVVAQWYALLPRLIEEVGEPDDASRLMRDPDIRAMLAIVEQTGAHELRSDYRDRRVPREGEIDRQFARADVRDFARHWFALAWSLPPPRDRHEVDVAVAAGLHNALEKGVPPGVALTQAIAELAEFADWISVMTLFQHGFGYPMDREFASRIKRFTDWSSGRPVVDVARANAELALQHPSE